MNFEYVLPELRKGKRVSRKIWLNQKTKSYLVFRINKIFLVYDDSPPYEKQSILFQIDDMLADDWEVLPDNS